MAKVHEQPAVSEAPDESVTARAHEQPKASKPKKDHGQTESHGQTVAAGASNGGGRQLGIGIVLGMILSVILRAGMRRWFGRSDLMGHKAPVSGLFNKMQTLAARLRS